MVSICEYKHISMYTCVCMSGCEEVQDPGQSVISLQLRLCHLSSPLHRRAQRRGLGSRLQWRTRCDGLDSAALITSVRSETHTANTAWRLLSRKLPTAGRKLVVLRASSVIPSACWFLPNSLFSAAQTAKLIKMRRYESVLFPFLPLFSFSDICSLKWVLRF